jgi:hypothetical protein
MANVKLSQAELKMVVDANLILTKNGIIAKVYDLMGLLSLDYTAILEKTNLPDELMTLPPKISKGENYLGLPWVMLDQPRCFKGNDAFAIRTFFWWGNFCSITLQLKGVWLQRYRQVVDVLSRSENANEWFVCNNEDEWQHHFEADNYMPFASFDKTINNKTIFLKLAKKIPLQEWDNIETFLKDSFLNIIDALQKASTSQAME